MTNNQRNYITAFKLAKKQLPDFSILVEAGIVDSVAEAEKLILDYEAGSPTKPIKLRDNPIEIERPLKKKTNIESLIETGQRKEELMKNMIWKQYNHKTG